MKMRLMKLQMQRGSGQAEREEKTHEGGEKRVEDEDRLCTRRELSPLFGLQSEQKGDAVLGMGGTGAASAWKDGEALCHRLSPSNASM